MEVTASTPTGFKGERSKKQLEASHVVNQYNKQNYRKVVERAMHGEPFIWTNVGVPTEIMFAMDIPILFNLNWSALLAAKQMGERYLNILNEHGYFRDLCRYCSLPLGYFVDRKPEQAPWGGLPRPAAVVIEAADNPIVRIYELMALELGVPLYIYDHTMPLAPPDSSWGKTVAVMEAESQKESWRLDYAVKETEALISFLENLSGKTLREAQLRKVMERSNEQFDLIGKVLELTKAIPCPMSMGDHIANLISTQFYRGHEFGLAQARRLYDEVKYRVENGVAAYADERIRLMHLGVPNWFSPGFYDAFEEQYGAVFVCMGYLPITQQLIRRNLSDPVKALASRYVGYTEMGLLPPWFIQWFTHYAKEFKVDGLVYQNAESCRLLSGPKRLFFAALKKEGIPFVELESDYVDVRDWDDAKMKAHMSHFIETLL